jgi:hypothetical protein
MKTAVREDVRSEEPKSSSTDTILKRAWLKRTQSNLAQRATLSGLQTSLGERIKELGAKKIASSRVQADLKRMIEGGTTRCVSADADISALALRLIAGEDLATVVTDATQGMEKLYVTIKASLSHDDKDDADVLKAVNFLRAGVMILQEAIVLQKRKLAETHTAAMAEFLPAIKEARGINARQFLVALADCQKAAEQDRLFADGLEPEEIQLLKPRPFPVRILSEDVLRWLFAAANEDLIGREDLQSARIDL